MIAFGTKETPKLTELCVFFFMFGQLGLSVQDNPNFMCKIRDHKTVRFVCQKGRVLCEGFCTSGTAESHAYERSWVPSRAQKNRRQAFKTTEIVDKKLALFELSTTFDLHFKMTFFFATVFTHYEDHTSQLKGLRYKIHKRRHFLPRRVLQNLLTPQFTKCFGGC